VIGRACPYDDCGATAGPGDVGTLLRPRTVYRDRLPCGQYCRGAQQTPCSEQKMQTLETRWSVHGRLNSLKMRPMMAVASISCPVRPSAGCTSGWPGQVCPPFSIVYRCTVALPRQLENVSSTACVPSSTRSGKGLRTG